MRDSLCRCRALAAALALVLLGAAPARADIFATFDTFEGVSSQHLATANLTTGARQTLHPSVDEAGAAEIHPSLSPDGQFLVFQRRTSGGTVRIVMVRRATGESADLFNAFEAAADPPGTPTFSPDGRKVITGRRLERRDPGSPPGALQASLTHTDVTSFPNGPFPHQIVNTGGLDSTSPGRTLQPTSSGPAHFAFGIEHDSGDPPGRVTVQQPSGTSTLVASNSLADPAVSQSAGVVVYESFNKFDPGSRALVFRPLAGIQTAPTTALPALVNDPGATASPTFSGDGRYLAFARFTSPGGNRILVWDTQTQLLLRADGVEGGNGPGRDGAMALEVRPVLSIVPPRITATAVSFGLVQDSAVGIIVQRIVGRTRVLGRRAPKLKFVGRVPLGSFKRGRRHRVRWNRRVGRRRLRRGRYLVTVRSVTRRGRVRDLAKPVRVRIR